MSDDDQHITLRINNAVGAQDIFISAIYAKCSTSERKYLWESLEQDNMRINGPWCIGGDFNMVLDPSEKMGGNPHRMSKSLHFQSYLDNSGLTDIGFTGSNFTWCNNRRPRKRIWKRLDRVCINNQWDHLFRNCSIRHLARTGSDHRPLLMKYQDSNISHVSYFRFLNFWVTQPDFMDIVKESWVLDKFGFSKVWLEIIYNLISENWYSVIINGSRNGFFSSSQGLKQGGPLSPSLSILAAEVLSRSLNDIASHRNFIPFTMPSNCSTINHLAYADDIVIFSSGKTSSLKLIMNTINDYENSSGQLVNGDKSFFFPSPRTSAQRINRIRNCTSFMDKSYPFTYLGCPLHVGRKKLEYFDYMISKVVKRLNGWHGGIGIRSMTDISNTLAMKRWWRFRTSNSLWDNFIKSKYCIRAHVVGKKWASGDSHAWKHMTLVREEAEKHMVWQVNFGFCSFWWDNWTCKGPLAHLVPNTDKSSKLLVKHFISQGKWDTIKLNGILTPQMSDSIRKIEIGNIDKEDQIFWDLTENGKYSNKSAWDLVRNKKALQPLINKVWHSSIPFKISFLIWRIWKNKLLFEEVISSFGKQMDSKCYCCNTASYQTMNHVFSQGTAASNNWNLFGAPLGIKHSHLPIRHIINSWWQEKAKNDVHRLILNITPIVICWALWKETCAYRYGNQNKFSGYKLEQQIMVICWQKPEPGVYKLNTDGSYNKNNRKAGLRGALRDANGQLIMAFSVAYQCNSHNMAEGSSMFNKIIEDTSEELQHSNVKFMHCYRGANQLADWLAKQEMKSNDNNIYLSDQELPNRAKGPYILDKRQVPSIRSKFDKANFFVS
ncbi:uncharacterized protein LOC132629107 [Lycium barbarum]|uniref:uncharacterized protein LOC132629107 n=1 Tax=Lycium barbarum TaxID=112863 RepID=UPI00293EF8FD|nr:uncharacterized protein LOC132629107 [Lycium barbarum]